MADIQVHCGSCGNEFNVTEDMAGLIATCPKCERQISVPLPDGIRESRPKLQMKKEETLSGGKRCPACNGSMAAEAIICVQCGYDTRTGRPLSPQGAGMKLLKPIFTLLGVIIVGGIAWSYMRMRSGSGIMGDPVPAPIAPATPVAEAPPVQPPAPATTMELEAAQEAEQELAVQETAPERGPSLEEIQKKMTAALDARYPMFTPGSAVVLRRTNGLVHRGTLVAYGQDFVALKTEEGQIQVPFDAMDSQTRMLCDAEFRGKYVEHRSKQAIPPAETF